MTTLFTAAVLAVISEAALFIFIPGATREVGYSLFILVYFIIYYSLRILDEIAAIKKRLDALDKRGQS